MCGATGEDDLNLNGPSSEVADLFGVGVGQGRSSSICLSGSSWSSAGSPDTGAPLLVTLTSSPAFALAPPI